MPDWNWDGAAWQGTSCTKNNTDAFKEGPGFTDFLLLIICYTIGPLLLGLAALVRLSCPAKRGRRNKDEASEMFQSESELGNMSPIESNTPTAENAQMPYVAHVASSDNRPRRNSLVEVAVSSFENTRRMSAELVEPFKLPAKRVMYFDVWRSLCTLLICVTHCDEVYAEWNVAAVQQWVLPFFSMISGMLYAKSRVSILEYTSRLMTYFSVGVIFNGTALMVTKQMWFGECFANDVLFQIAFVILFAGGAVVAVPLKNQLCADSFEKKRLYAGVNIVGCICILIAIGVLYSMIQDRDGLLRILRYLGEIFVSLLFTSIAAYFLPAQGQGVIGWITLFWMYATRVAIREQRPGLEFHFIELYIWAMVVQKIPLMGQERVGVIMARSWPLFLVAIALIKPPGAFGRIDRIPFTSWGLRLRQYIPEALTVVGFISVPSAGPKETLPFLDAFEPHMGWLSNWALLAFVSHKAIYYLLGGPLGLPVVLCTGFFWFFLSYRK